MLSNLIDAYEELKKYIYIIDRGNLKPIIITFKNENFYHLIGLHKLNIDMFFPKEMHSKDKRYKHIKKNIHKYENIIQNQIKDKHSIELRMTSFINIINLLSSNDTKLYNLKSKVVGSMYEGDYGIANNFDEIQCLLGLINDNEENYIPQSWMASNRTNKLLFGKPPLYLKEIKIIPKSVYTNKKDKITI